MTMLDNCLITFIKSKELNIWSVYFIDTNTNISCCGITSIQLVQSPKTMTVDDWCLIAMVPT